jgi:hypothetical protein
MIKSKKEVVLNDLKYMTEADKDYCLDLPIDLASNLSYQSANTGALSEMIDYWNDSDVDLILDEHCEMVKTGELPSKETLALIGEVLLLEMAKFSLISRLEDTPPELEPISKLDERLNHLDAKGDREADERRLSA